MNILHLKWTKSKLSQDFTSFHHPIHFAFFPYLFKFKHLFSIQVDIFLVNSFDGHFTAFIKSRRDKYLFVTGKWPHFIWINSLQTNQFNLIQINAFKIIKSVLGLKCFLQVDFLVWQLNKDYRVVYWARCMVAHHSTKLSMPLNIFLPPVYSDDSQKKK